MGKAKKNSEEEATVLRFLIKSNRPFSVQNIVDSLQRAGIKKAAAERSLASLVEKRSVTKKEYGKAKIFIASQQNIALPSEEESKLVKEEICALSATVEETTQRVRKKRERLAELRSQLTLTEATARAKEIKGEIEKKEEKLALLGDGSGLMSKEDKLKLEVRYYDALTAWKKYRRIVGDIVGQVSEGMGKKVSDLYEEIGVERDEEAKTKLEHFPSIGNPNKKQRVMGQHGRASKRSRPC